MIPTTADDELLETYISRLVAAYLSATPAQYERGRHWYPTAHELAGIIGGGDARKGAGLIAALSANKNWDDNVKLATDAGNGNVHGHTAITLRKVEAILEGADPEEVLPLDAKTGHFFRAIADPYDPDPAVIDRHIHDVIAGEVYGNRDRGLSNKTRYATCALAVRLSARRLGLLTSQFQATVWVVQLDSVTPLKGRRKNGHQN